LVRNKSKRTGKKERFRKGLYQKEAKIIKIYTNGYCLLEWSHTGGYLTSEIAGSRSKYNLSFLKKKIMEEVTTVEERDCAEEDEFAQNEFIEDCVEEDGFIQSSGFIENCSEEDGFSQNEFIENCAKEDEVVQSSGFTENCAEENFAQPNFQIDNSSDEDEKQKTIERFNSSSIGTKLQMICDGQVKLGKREKKKPRRFLEE
jgi:hypothetical protein